MYLYFNPLDKECKSVKGAVEQGREIELSIYTDMFDSASLYIEKDDKSYIKTLPLERKNKNKFTITIALEETGLYWYLFKFDDKKFLSRGNKRNAVLSSNAIAYQLTVYKKGYKTPDWFKGGIMYQIFPDRFCREGNTKIQKDKILRDDWGALPEFLPKNGKVLNNDFFGGTLKGIESKLDYLKSLNVSIIYLNPIFEAYSNHRYDTGDYMKIDSLLGTEEDLKSLISKAEEKGIRLIFDGVYNHTGSDSKYFNKYGKYDSVGAYQSKSSKYYSWSTFLDYPKKYESWWGIDVLPALNHSSSELREYFVGSDGVIAKWMKDGFAGVRLDVADELTDDFLVQIRKRVKTENKNAIVIGEVWEDASNKVAYGQRRKYLQGSELDSVMNYPLKDAIIDYAIKGDANKLVSVICEQIDNYPKQVLDCLMNFLGTHDTARILTVLSGKDMSGRKKCDRAVEVLTKEEYALAKERIKIATTLLYTLYGVPCIYYGDEVGMEGYEDPFNRRCLVWDKRDEEIFSHYKKLGEIRAKNGYLKDADTEIIKDENGLIVFKRISDMGVMLVAVNVGYTKYILNLSSETTELLTEEVNNKFDISHNSCKVFRLK